MILTPETVSDFLGPQKFRDLQADKENEVGATVGLAWTEVGGTILTTEAAVMEGKGKLQITGKLGDVMQESAHAAMSYVGPVPICWAFSGTSTATSIFTCMFRKAQSPRTAPPPESPSQPASVAL